MKTGKTAGMFTDGYAYKWDGGGGGGQPGYKHSLYLTRFHLAYDGHTDAIWAIDETSAKLAMCRRYNPSAAAQIDRIIREGRTSD